MDRNSRGYQVMQSRKKILSRKELETAREAASSTKKPASVLTPRPRLAPGKGRGRKRLFEEKKEERLARPSSQEDIFADCEDPVPESSGSVHAETSDGPPLFDPSPQASSTSLPMVPTTPHLGKSQNQSAHFF